MKTRKVAGYVVIRYNSENGYRACEYKEGFLREGEYGTIFPSITVARGAIQSTLHYSEKHKILWPGTRLEYGVTPLVKL